MCDLFLPWKWLWGIAVLYYFLQFLFFFVSFFCHSLSSKCNIYHYKTCRCHLAFTWLTLTSLTHTASYLIKLFTLLLVFVCALELIWKDGIMDWVWISASTICHTFAHTFPYIYKGIIKKRKHLLTIRGIDKLWLTMEMKIQCFVKENIDLGRVYLFDFELI